MKRIRLPRRPHLPQRQPKPAREPRPLAAGVLGRSRTLALVVIAARVTAAVPPIAAAAALAVGLGVLKRVVEHRPANTERVRDFAGVVSDVVEAAKASMRATAAAGNQWSVDGLRKQFPLTRAQATKVRQAVLAESNGHPTE